MIFDALGPSEAIKIRTLKYYLEEEAKEGKEAQIQYMYYEFGAKILPEYFRSTWPLLAETLI